MRAIPLLLCFLLFCLTGLCAKRIIKGNYGISNSYAKSKAVHVHQKIPVVVPAPVLLPPSSSSLPDAEALKALRDQLSAVVSPISSTQTRQQEPVTYAEPIFPLSNERKTLFIKRYNDTSLDAKPVLLFMPGLDGVGSYSKQSFHNLSNLFDIYCLEIKPEDRSTFTEVSAFLLDVLQREPFVSKQVTLMGESTGALFACYLALRSTKKKAISQLLLVNPATSYYDSIWPTLGPLIAQVPEPIFPAVGMGTLLLTAVEPRQIRSIGQPILDRINSTATAVAELQKLAAMGSSFTNILGPQTLDWRLRKWLDTGNFVMQDRYKEISTPTLLLVGEDDRLLPSAKEAKRLARDMVGVERGIEVCSFKNRGHALLDGTVNLKQVVLDSRTFRSAFVDPSVTTVSSSSPLDCPYPSPSEIAAVDEQLSVFVKTLSPVFFSRSGADRKISRGLGNVPVGKQGRPVLLVGNHQLYGADLGLIVREFLRERQTLIRGLAHPIIFQTQSTTSGQGEGQEAVPTMTGGGPGMRNLFQRFGAVEVNPMNYYELLDRNETILLFPGGVREAYHQKGEEYKLFWPEKVDFVRMAALKNAIIVPFGAIGMAESVNMVLDANDIARLPVLGQRAKEANKNVPQARAGLVENFVAPFSVPSTPARNYFLFQEPIDMGGIDIYDKIACREVYGTVKSRVEESISTLLKLRKQDPYREFIPRSLYELTSRGKQAPTTSSFSSF